MLNIFWHRVIWLRREASGMKGVTPRTAENLRMKSDSPAAAAGSVRLSIHGGI
jgi:hypothetical protein